MHTTLGGGQGQSKQLSFGLVGHDVGRECLCNLLGIGINRFRKTMNLIPDGRIGMSKTGSHRDTASVDAFLTVLYEGVAETLPDRLDKVTKAKVWQGSCCRIDDIQMVPSPTHFESIALQSIAIT